MSLSWIPWNRRVLELEDVVTDVFAIHDVSTRAGSQIVVFKGQFLRSPEMVYNAVVDRFKTSGYIPILREEEDHDLLMAYPAPSTGRSTHPLVHLGLFLLTVVSTLWAGTTQVTNDFGLQNFMENWTAGIPFTVPLLLILGVHEFGHYFVARRYGLDVSLPYFIPFPLNPLVGTLGAVIRIQSPFESKKALFDVGIAGPLAGLAVAIPVTIYGLMLAEITPITPSDGTMVFHEPLLFQWLALLIVGERGPGEDIIMNPYLMAGWLGFLVTALNLIPVSQLDGGHIAYSLLGKHYRYFAWGIFATAAAVTLLRTPGFLLMLAFIFMMGIEHPPALNDVTRVGPARVILGVLTFILGLTLVTLTPFEILGGG